MNVMNVMHAGISPMRDSDCWENQNCKESDLEQVYGFPCWNGSDFEECVTLGERVLNHSAARKVCWKIFLISTETFSKSQEPIAIQVSTQSHLFIW